MRNITLQTLRNWDACYKGYDKIAEHVKEGEVITLDLALRVVEVEDVVWALAYDPDRYRWLSFLADMIDLPGCEAIVQAVRDYRDGKVSATKLKKFAVDARLSAINARVTINARATINIHDTNIFHDANAAYAANAANAAISISGKPRLVKLIRSHYQ